MTVAVSPAPRRPASAVPSITRIRISPPGFSATIINISASGLLAEWGLPLPIGQAVTVAFEGASTPRTVAALVVRSSIVSTTSGGLRYQVALAFNAPIALEGASTPKTSADREGAPATSGQASPNDIVNRW